MQEDIVKIRATNNKGNVATFGPVLILDFLLVANIEGINQLDVRSLDEKLVQRCCCSVISCGLALSLK